MALPRFQLAVDVDGQRLGLALQQALRGQNVADFGGANAECQCAERAVRGGVAVAADDRHARLGGTILRPDHVDDAAMIAAPAVQLDAEFGAVGFQHGDLLRGLWRDIGVVACRIGGRRWRGMIQRGQHLAGATHGQAALAQFGERLRRGHLVDQVQVDVKRGRGGGGFGDDFVCVPDFFEQGFLAHAAISEADGA
jgi:hypothetical protein